MVNNRAGKKPAGRARVSSDELKQQLTRLMQQWAMKQAEANMRAAEANQLGQLVQELMEKIEIQEKGKDGTTQAKHV